MPKSRHKKSGKSGSNPRNTHHSQKASTFSTSTIILSVAVALAVLVGAYFLLRGGGASGEEVRTASGLRYIDLVKGTGASPQQGQPITVHYTGMLENGKKFESSRDTGQPYTFRIGVDPVIRGWLEGLMSMKVGGKRRLIIPPELGYGAAGHPPNIPPNATLIFEVELLRAQ